MTEDHRYEIQVEPVTTYVADQSRFFQTPLIAVTGTNAKTTTDKLMAEVFRNAGKSVFLGGNVDNPLIEYVLHGHREEYIIAEISSFQLEGIQTFRPFISVLRSISNRIISTAMPPMVNTSQPRHGSSATSRRRTMPFSMPTTPACRSFLLPSGQPSFIQLQARGPLRYLPPQQRFPLPGWRSAADICCPSAPSPGRPQPAQHHGCGCRKHPVRVSPGGHRADPGAFRRAAPPLGVHSGAERDTILQRLKSNQRGFTPGRAAFITGQMPIRTGLTTVSYPGSPIGIDPRDPTQAEVLKTVGYRTGQFGKNHLGDRNSHLPTVHGFDVFYGNLYHLNSEEEPEDPDWPTDKAFNAKYLPRGVLDCVETDTETRSGPASVPEPLPDEEDDARCPLGKRSPNRFHPGRSERRARI